MANQERGEVDLVAGDSVYTLALSMNAICDMQTRTGTAYTDLLVALPRDMTVFREMLFTVLRRHHAKQFPTLSSVGEMVDALPNGNNDAAAALRKLLEINAERGNGAGHAADPPIAQT